MLNNIHYAELQAYTYKHAYSGVRTLSAEIIRVINNLQTPVHCLFLQSIS